jgi:glycosyltransferase involved in cell wall biosynthesis
VSAPRVLHAPAEIAGQASTLARALRALGVEAHSLAYNPGFPQYEPDEMRPYDAMSPLPRYAGYLASALRHYRRWDVYHFHFGRTLIPPHNVDLPLLRALGKRVVFHYHGCDVRDREFMLAHHERATCTECDPFCVPARQRRILASAVRHADAELISTPDLLDSAPRAGHLPVAAEITQYPFAPPRGAPKLVVHAPTNRLIKGTRYVEAAFEALKPEFPGVRFAVAEKLPWRELMALLQQADVVVDQLFMGWYGMVAVEAMALGKPVLCFIREDFEPLLRDCPIVRCSSADLVARLRETLAAADLVALGERGRAYAEREHDARAIAGRLVRLYATLGGDAARA